MAIKRAVFAGSFDPITNGHISLIKQGLKLFDEIIVLLAINPNRRYAYSLQRRLLMVKIATKKLKHVIVDSTDGLTIDYAKKCHASALLRGVRNKNDIDYELFLANMNQKLTNKIPTIFLVADEKSKIISATKVRALKKKGANLSSFVPPSIIKYL